MNLGFEEFTHNCSKNGKYNQETNSCKCDEGYTSADCSTPLTNF